MKAYQVMDLFEQHAEKLQLELLAGEKGLARRLLVPEVQRPGLALSGYMKGYADKRILILGKVEMSYLRGLGAKLRFDRLAPLLTNRTPAVMIARHYRPPSALVQLCKERALPLLRTPIGTMDLLNKLTQLLNEEFLPSMTCHGTLVEVFGVGMLIQGNSSVGKSEAALGLIERGHRLVSDDVVKIMKREGAYIEGCGSGITQYHMEIRGIGIINVAHLYGAVCVRPSKSIDLVVRLENWDDNHFYDRVGLEEHTCDLLGIPVPSHLLPVKPGRDVVLLLETVALNHRLKVLGYNSAKEFSSKLLELTSSKKPAMTNGKQQRSR